jgi:hypothetical protein
MSNHILTALAQELAESRSEFLRNVPNFSSPQREQLTAQFFATEQLYLGLIANFLIRQAPLTINIPFDMGALTPVLTTPTAEQVATEVQDYMHLTVQQCAICQDDISSDGFTPTRLPTFFSSSLYSNLVSCKCSLSSLS